MWVAVSVGGGRRDECERSFDGDARPRPTAQDINDSDDSDVTYQYIGLQWSNQVPHGTDHFAS